MSEDKIIIIKKINLNKYFARSKKYNNEKGTRFYIEKSKEW